MYKKISIVFAFLAFCFVTPSYASAHNMASMDGHATTAAASARSPLLAYLPILALVVGAGLLIRKSPRKAIAYFILFGLLTIHVVPSYLLSQSKNHTDHNNHATDHSCCIPATTDVSPLILELPKVSFATSLDSHTPQDFTDSPYSSQQPRSPPFAS